MNLVLILLISTSFTQAFAQDYSLGEIVVESSKTKSNWYDIGTSSKIISAEVIENERTVLEALKASGIEVSQSGANGNSAIYLRGFSGKHTIVMIDGIPINDISNPNGEFNASYLKNINVERIEVLKGAQSVLHGGALAGIVNIITKRTKAPNKVYGSVGSYDSQNAGVVISNDGTKGVSHLTGDFQRVAGLSETSMGSEEDEFKALNTTISFGYGLTENVFARTYLQRNETDQEYDDGTNLIDSNINEVQSSLLLLTQNFEVELDKNLFSELDISVLKSEREYSGSWVSSWKGNQYRIENRYRLLIKEMKLLAGYTGTLDKVQSGTLDEDINQLDVFSSITFDINGFTFVEGIRRIHHSEFGDHNLYQSSISRKLNDWNLGISYGTSFRAPSIGELYTPSTGNAELNPEEAQSWELNIKKVSAVGSTQVSFFKQKIKNNIIFTSKMVNEGELEVKGVELEQQHRFDHFLFNLNLTYNDPSDHTGGRPLRRAYFRSAFFLNYKLSDQENLIAKHRYTGDRLGVSNNKLGSYHLVDFSYKLIKGNKEIKLSVNNIFDKNYFESFGYQTMRRNYLAEIAYNF